jgi:hypothetical protein
MKVSIDRIEDGIAVLVMLEDPFTRINVPVSLLPPGFREGDVLTLTLEADPAGTSQAKERVTGLIDRLKEKNKFF